MTDEEKVLWAALENASNQLQLASDHLFNGALMKYPHTFSDPEMVQLQNHCIAQTEKNLERLKQLTGTP
jgi:hypothetical protein